MEEKIVLVVGTDNFAELARALGDSPVAGIVTFESEEKLQEALASPEPQLPQILEDMLFDAAARPARAYLRLDAEPVEVGTAFYPRQRHRDHPYTARDLRRQERGRGRRVTR